MEYYLAIKTIDSLVHAAREINFGNIEVSERDQVQKTL